MTYASGEFRTLSRTSCRSMVYKQLTAYRWAVRSAEGLAPYHPLGRDCTLAARLRLDFIGPHLPAAANVARQGAPLPGFRSLAPALWESPHLLARRPPKGIRILLNECESISRVEEAIYLAGIDDAHYYRVDSIEKAGAEIPDDPFSILLSHTPEVYRQA